MKQKNTLTRKRIYEIVEVGQATDTVSRSYDILYAVLILLNLTASISLTFDAAEARFGTLLSWVEYVTVALFGVDYVLRIISAPEKYPGCSKLKAALRYIFSFLGIIDLMAFLPYLLPFFFPAGAVAFRLFRIIRIFRLFRINAYYDSLNVITEVLKSKRQQLISSVFIIFVLMLFSSMCMYSIEHDAQPEVFRNAFSGIWWSVSTLLTVGYGDIYPITTLGRVFGIVITFLGVGMVAIPTGIISAGFVDQYSRAKRMSEFGPERDVQFVRIAVSENDMFVGKRICELMLPENLLVAAISRNGRIIVPSGEAQIRSGDVLTVAAKAVTDEDTPDMKEIVLAPQHPWVGMLIRELDISRKTFIVLILRGKETVIPTGYTMLKAGDRLMVYSRSSLPEQI